MSSCHGISGSSRHTGKPPGVSNVTTRAFRVGLTGGIASGKSTVAKLFAALGVPVIDADELAREVVVPGSEVLARIHARFGNRVLAADGTLDRRVLRDIVFADPSARAELEALTHPAIRAAMEERSAVAGGTYQMLAIPLLIEKGGATPVDRILVVDCDEPLQIRRLQARDGSTLEQARAILAAQAPREARLRAADDVIVNDDGLQALRTQVERLHATYVRLGMADRRL
jgi:dephospho-CoA kinase